MKIFIQGMRRSATTLLYDVLCADGRFDAYYEPLAAARRTAAGGGSRNREEDFFEKIRQIRSAYAQATGLTGLSLLNWGAPRDPALETGPAMDERVVGYLRYLLQQRDDTLLKFVRAYDKIPLLDQLCPGAFLLHVVRDPRAVASSFLLGKGQIHRSAYASNDQFFQYRTEGTQTTLNGPKSVQALQVASHLIRTGSLAVEPDAPAYEKLLALWAYHFRHTHRDGQPVFGRRYALVRYEDLLRQPEPTLRRIYATLGEECAPSSLRWLLANLANRPQVFAEEDLRWTRSCERLKLRPELEDAGYASLLSPPPSPSL